jgi:hypothetical protein
MPTLHNPLGWVLNAGQRQALADLARQHDLLRMKRLQVRPLGPTGDGRQLQMIERRQNLEARIGRYGAVTSGRCGGG